MDDAESKPPLVPDMPSSSSSTSGDIRTPSAGADAVGSSDAPAVDPMAAVADYHPRPAPSNSIFVCYDASPAAERALALAEGLVRPNGVLHVGSVLVRKDGADAGGPLEFGTAAEDDEAAAAAKAEIDATFGDLEAAFTGVDGVAACRTTLVEDSSGRRAVVALARRADTDLVIVGDFGAERDLDGSAGDDILGSVAHHVVHNNVAAPTMVVRSLTQDLQPNGSRRLLVGFNGSKASKRALRYLLLAGEGGVDWLQFCGM